VFISHAREDSAWAQRISQVLARSGIATAQQTWDASSRQDLAGQLREITQASDVVVVLLSPAVSLSELVGESELTLSRDLDRRDVDLIPVLAAPTDLSPTLQDWAVIDLTQDATEGLQQLVTQIETTSRVDFSGMTPQAFDDLIADLLRTTGFSLEGQRQRHYKDPGVDMRATYQRLDPFGRLETEVWLVQTKLYSRERVSVDAIRQLVGILATGTGATRGLLVTNGQLTSVATEYLAKMERSSHVRLGVLDGVELRRLLRQFPVVAARHFSGAVSSGGGRDGNP
jgi:hypothetical protein